MTKSHAGAQSCILLATKLGVSLRIQLVEEKLSFIKQADVEFIRKKILEYSESIIVGIEVTEFDQYV